MTSLKDTLYQAWRDFQKSWRLYGSPTKNLVSSWFSFLLVQFWWLKDSLLKLFAVESRKLQYLVSEFPVRSILTIYGGILRRRDRAWEASSGSKWWFGFGGAAKFDAHRMEDACPCDVSLEGTADPRALLDVSIWAAFQFLMRFVFCCKNLIPNVIAQWA